MSDARAVLAAMLERMPRTAEILERLTPLARSEPRALASALEALRASPEGGAASDTHWVLSRYVEHALGSARTVEAGEALLRLACTDVAPVRIFQMRRAFTSGIRRRWIAALLASGLESGSVLELLERNEERADSFELRALLLHELVLRAGGMEVEDQPVAARLVREMRGREHPLAALPLRRLPLESGVAVPPFPAGLWVERPAVPAFAPRTGTPIRRGWMEASQPRPLAPGPASGPDEIPELSCIAFSLPPEARGTDDVSVLATLPIAALDPAPPGRSAQPLTPDEAFALLVATSARTPGFPVNDIAVPRLRAWEQARYLLGAGASASPRDVDALAGTADWTRHAAIGGWFAADDVDTALLLTARTGDRFAVLVYCHTEPKT